jgi:hypothetical protein
MRDIGMRGIGMRNIAIHLRLQTYYNYDLAEPVSVKKRKYVWTCQ